MEWTVPDSNEVDINREGGAGTYSGRPNYFTGRDRLYECRAALRVFCVGGPGGML